MWALDSIERDVAAVQQQREQLKIAGKFIWLGVGFGNRTHRIPKIRQSSRLPTDEQDGLIFQF